MQSPSEPMGAVTSRYSDPAQQPRCLPDEIVGSFYQACTLGDIVTANILVTRARECVEARRHR